MFKLNCSSMKNAASTANLTGGGLLYFRKENINLLASQVYFTAKSNRTLHRNVPLSKDTSKRVIFTSLSKIQTMSAEQPGRKFLFCLFYRRFASDTLTSFKMEVYIPSFQISFNTHDRHPNGSFLCFRIKVVMTSSLYSLSDVPAALLHGCWGLHLTTYEAEQIQNSVQRQRLLL